MSDATKTSKTSGATMESELLKVDFATFVLSLSTSALYHLGELPDPVTGKIGEKNLVIVRQTVDTLELLQQKTVGNLEPEEANLLNSLIYELRMKVIKES